MNNKLKYLFLNIFFNIRSNINIINFEKDYKSFRKNNKESFNAKKIKNFVLDENIIPLQEILKNLMKEKNKKETELKNKIDSIESLRIEIFSINEQIILIKKYIEDSEKIEKETIIPLQENLKNLMEEKNKKETELKNKIEDKESIDLLRTEISSINKQIILTRKNIEDFEKKEIERINKKQKQKEINNFNPNFLQIMLADLDKFKDKFSKKILGFIEIEKILLMNLLNLKKINNKNFSEKEVSIFSNVIFNMIFSQNKLFLIKIFFKAIDFQKTKKQKLNIDQRLELYFQEKINLKKYFGDPLEYLYERIQELFNIRSLSQNKIIIGNIINGIDIFIYNPMRLFLKEENNTIAFIYSFSEFNKNLLINEKEDSFFENETDFKKNIKFEKEENTLKSGKQIDFEKIISYFYKKTKNLMQLEAKFSILKQMKTNNFLNLFFNEIELKIIDKSFSVLEKKKYPNFSKEPNLKEKFESFNKNILKSINIQFEQQIIKPQQIFLQDFQNLNEKQKDIKIEQDFLKMSLYFYKEIKQDKLS